MPKVESASAYQERKRCFELAETDYHWYESGLGRLLPDAAQKRHAAIQEMWKHANAPAPGLARRAGVNNAAGWSGRAT